MYTTACSIKNSDKAIEWLNKLGYEEYNSKQNPYLATFIDTQSWFTSIPFKWGIYCEHLSQFKAISAIRDDSDYMQVFITDADEIDINTGIEYPEGSPELYLSTNRYDGEAHKASVEEIMSIPIDVLDKFYN